MTTTTSSMTSSGGFVRRFSASPETLVCVGCGGDIKDSKAMKAGSNYWHESHFTCSECGTKLKDAKVFAKDEKLFCDADYKSKFVPRCAYCSGFILESCIRALNQAWHPEHFMCHKCGLPFEKDQGFHERNGFPYCKPCYVEVACEKCGGCGKAITDKAMKAMEKDWHVECFVCKNCGKSFEGEKTFYCVGGQPVCGNCVDN